ncbi:MAG: hypothetical protein JW937_01440 [Candidatus Omnitrophica bacterium]|nr:hypothetical protein [Candidatus Omnitrophota bacterium]
MLDLSQVYDQGFYSGHLEGSLSSAKVILGLLFDFYHPKSVIDIGCGYGAWLAVAKSLGSITLRGLDGDWIGEDNLIDSSIEFTSVNFERDIEIQQRFDLCLCLEVAEHISEGQAGAFVNLLCRVSDVIVFSAAVKGQGGTNHINEQWPSYWIERFRSGGYECFDIFRGRIWNDERVVWWYRQNVLLFVNTQVLGSLFDPGDLRDLERKVFDMVHPAHYECRSKEYRNTLEAPTLRSCIRMFGRYLLKKIKE